MGDLGAYKENVKFSNGDAQSLIAACNSAAATIEGQVGSRQSWRMTGEEQFKGYFSTLFQTNGATQIKDAGELATALRSVSTMVVALRQSADDEQHRRQKARDWEDKQNNRNGLEKIGDGISHLWGGDEPPVPGPASQLHQSAAKPATGSRQTPAPGAGGAGSSGTSSAIPDNLTSFASNSKAGDATLADHQAAVQKAYTAFTSSCGWGHLDASGVVTAFQQFLAANAQEVTWATTLAAAFEQAGGHGSICTVSNQALGAALAAAHVSAGRQDITIDMPSVLGGVPTSGFADDPVNTATGNFTEPETDFAFDGGSGTLSFGRVYNSAAGTVGAFGPGWASWSESALLFTDREARWVLPEGRHVVFPRLASGWDRAIGASYWLVERDETLLVSDNSGGSWSFTFSGRLESFERGPGTRVEVKFDADARFTSLVHERGRSVTVEWSDDRIVSAVSSDGRRIDYGYDSLGRLTNATGPTGERRYVWGDESGLIEQVIDGDGVIEVLNGYDDKGRVAWQKSPFGRVSRYSYLPGGITEVADRDGERSNTWVADAAGRLTGVIDSDGYRQSYSWDAYGNMIEATDRVGQKTVRSYDDRGRLIRQFTATGADLQYGYDEQDRVVTVVAGAVGDAGTDSVIGYEYQGADRNPSVLIDASGGRTALAWDRNLLIEVTDPIGVTLRFAYDSRGDLVSTTNAVGDVARLERDDAGRVLFAVTPSGHRTTYAYGESGLPVSRQDADGGVWRFEHTAAGRLAAQVAPDGGRSELEYGPTGQETRTIDPLGRVITRALDDIGNLASVQLPDGTSWSYAHDGLSRLVETVDPTGGVWSNRYDANGEPVATTDPSGVTRTTTVDRRDNSVTADDGLLSSTLRRDAFGRPHTVESNDDDSQTLVYDASGRVVEVLDPEGALTLIRRDAAGRPVEITDPTGAITRYMYDVCGRLIEEIGPDGGVTTREYDADSLLVRQTLPNGDAAWAKYDACGRLTQMHQPGFGTATYGYDKCGRVTFTSDIRWGIRRLAYDQAGQLIAVTNGLGGVTRYEYDENSRLVRVTDPAGGVTSRVWDGMNRPVSETDPLGHTTTAGYDTAGRQTWQQAADGPRLDFGFDSTGRDISVSVDDTVICSVIRDQRSRVQTIADLTGPSPVTHVMEWDRAGRLVRDSRAIEDGDARGMSWSYDSAGRRTSMIDAFGRTTEYHYDIAGRLTKVTHPALGIVAFGYDAAGQLITATTSDPAGRTSDQVWEWVDGTIATHTTTSSVAAGSTVIDHDADGRIVGITRDGASTSYGYDLAEQLTEAITDGARQTWAFDPNGRMVQHTRDGATETYGYDPAGRLIAEDRGDGATITHSYDPSGRRVGTFQPDGATRDYEWTPTGLLSSLTDKTDGGAINVTSLHSDATAQLTGIGGATLWWDTAAAVPTLAGVDDTTLLPLGAVTGISDQWMSPGWRANRGDAIDPWQVAPVFGLSGGLGLTVTGTLTMGDAPGFSPLEWLGARTYDPATRVFLTIDPVEPVTGSGWAANPYNYAGNNPLAFSDPTGLHPLTDAELKKQTRGWLADAWDATSAWATTGWGAWVIGGLMVVGGGILMATGVGGPAGAMLLSAGADTLIQKATTGTVDYKEVALSGALGGIGDFGVAAKLGVTGVKAALVSGAVAGGTGGAVLGEYNYYRGPGPHTAMGALEHGATGVVSGAVSGAAGSAFTHVAGNRISDAVASKLHPDGVHIPQHAAGVGRHAAPSNYAGHAASLAATHTTAGVLAATNDYVAGDRDPGAIARSGGLGVIMGSYSPEHVPQHAAH
jgi:YD repeat-containing protein